MPPLRYSWRWPSVCGDFAGGNLTETKLACDFPAPRLGEVAKVRSEFAAAEFGVCPPRYCMNGVRMQQPPESVVASRKTLPRCRFRAMEARAVLLPEAHNDTFGESL